MPEIVFVRTPQGPTWLGVCFYPSTTPGEDDLVELLWGQLGYRGRALTVSELSALAEDPEQYDEVSDAARSHWDSRMVQA